ncbi:MAG: hypothetical protein ACYCX4_17095 [Bacillota bacterium]
MERPIIMTAESIKAIRDGRMTMTRRVIRGLGNHWRGSILLGDWGLSKEPKIVGNDLHWVLQTEVDDNHLFKEKLPWQPGDTLWVKETWAWTNEGDYRYKADISGRDDIIREATGHKWKSSRYMPKGVARIFLTVKSIRVGRVQDITREDAVAEGITEYLSQFNTNLTEEDADIWRNRTTVENFAAVWNSINKKRGYPFESSPWVWVIEFERRLATHWPRHVGRWPGDEDQLPER